MEKLISWLSLGLFLVLIIAQFTVTKDFSPPQLFGNRGQAIFDLWSLQHFCSGIFLGTIFLHLVSRHKLKPKDIFLAIFLVALVWEMTELFTESGWFGRAILNWKNGHEHWSNRLIGDPLLVTLGSVVVYRFRHAWKVVLAPSLIWLFLNITSPHSMYIQTLIFG